jgi:caspase domain-containing protein
MGRNFCLAGLLLAASAALAQSGERTLGIVPKEAASGESRHALVIGNGAYANGPLRNPVNDARAMAQALGEAGFNVMLVENATRAGMHRAIRTFGSLISKGGVGLFYYAGHGIQTGGRNFLIPVNADIEQEYEIEFGSIDMNLVLATMDSAKNGLNIVILDACRNNPFSRGFRSVQAGLAQMEAPTGTFIAFATAPGSVAADGAGENGVYTKYLLAEMALPGVPIELMFKQVRNGVMAETKGRQIPWESSSLRGEFAFRGIPGAVAQPNQAEIEKLIREALDRQRKQFEELGFRPPPVDAPRKEGAPAIASLAPSGPASALRTPSLPRQGDTFTYELIQPDRRDRRQSIYTVTVKAVTRDVVLEQVAVTGNPPIEWAHTGGPYVVNLGVSVFSPYLSAFGRVGPETRLGSAANLDHSTCQTGWTCRVQATIAGRERIRIPAGTFDTVRVRIEQSWSGGTLFWSSLGGRTLTVWYAPEINRALKYQNREWSSRGDGVTGNFDLELTSYQLKQ